MKTRPAIAWGLLIAAPVILANPMPLLFDFLPDVIAFGLVLPAIGRATGVMSEFNDLKTGTLKLLVVTAAKIPAFFIMLMIWGGDTRQRSIVAVFTLVFALVEFFCLRAWTHDLFSALSRFGERYDCHAALAEEGRHFRMPPEKLEKLTLAFFAVRSVLSCLPEMTLVPIQTETSERTFPWSMLYAVCAVTAALIVLIFGIWWCGCFISYLRRIAADREANGRLLTALAEGGRPDRRNKYRLLRLSTVLFIVGICFTFDIYFDRMNYLPDTLAALSFFGAAYCLAHLLGGRRALWITALVYAGATLTHTIFSVSFFREFSPEAVELIPAAESAYLRVLITSAISEALLLALCVLFFLATREVIRRYTGVAPADAAYTHTEQATRAELNRKSLLCTVLGALTAAASFFYELTLVSTRSVETDPTRTSGYLNIPTLDWFWAVVWGLGILWLLFSLHTTSRLREEAEINLIDE